MKKTLLFSTFCCFLAAISAVTAQTEQHFRASVAAGANFSQMEGDAQQGYHKVGVSIGAKGAYCFKPNFDVSTELLYNSRGSRPNPSEEITFADKSLHMTAELNYADILLAANFHFMPNSNYTFYRQSLQIGVSYGRLLSSKVTVNRGTFNDVTLQNDILDRVKRDDISFVVGYSWFLTPRLGLTAKHALSLQGIYSNSGVDNTVKAYTKFVPYNISLQLVYNLFTPKLNIKSQVDKANKAKERRKKNALEDL
jgi:Outer membrane protein beta-barrel domain